MKISILWCYCDRLGQTAYAIIMASCLNGSQAGKMQRVEMIRIALKNGKTCRFSPRDITPPQQSNRFGKLWSADSGLLLHEDEIPAVGRNGFAPATIMAMLPRMPDCAFHEFKHGLFAAIDISARRPIPREVIQ